MNAMWNMPPDPEKEPIGVVGWLRVAVKGPLFALVVFGIFGLTLPLRLIERPLCGLGRPVTPYITKFAAQMAVRVLGIKLVIRGKRMKEAGAVVTNHSSWLDIFVLNACKRIYFVSKSEVSKWPLIGWLANATGTVFINRNRNESKIQQQQFEDRLLVGHKLLFFPEGTSTDGMSVLPFKSTLFQAFFSEHLKHKMHIQAVSVVYWAPEGCDPKYYGWWGGMDFGSHLVKILASNKKGRVEVTFHEPVRVDSFANRKSLAIYLEHKVRGGMPAERQVIPSANK